VVTICIVTCNVWDLCILPKESIYYLCSQKITITDWSLSNGDVVRCLSDKKWRKQVCHAVWFQKLKSFGFWLKPLYVTILMSSMSNHSPETFQNYIYLPQNKVSLMLPRYSLPPLPPLILISSPFSLDEPYTSKKTAPVFNNHGMKAYGRANILLHECLSSAMGGDKWTDSRPRPLWSRGHSPLYVLDSSLGKT
jgi:hypothetical protein